MKPQMKFTTVRRDETTIPEMRPRPPGREFGSVEEMLRHDAAQHPVPPGLSGRLRQSLAKAPEPAPSWWQRLFKRKA